MVVSIISSGPQMCTRSAVSLGAAEASKAASMRPTAPDHDFSSDLRMVTKYSIGMQDKICAICHFELTDYNDVVLDHENPKGMGGAWRDDSPSNDRAVHWWCNSEKGSTRMDE